MILVKAVEEHFNPFCGKLREGLPGGDGVKAKIRRINRYNSGEGRENEEHDWNCEWYIPGLGIGSPRGKNE